ncbi:MAG: DUF4013 domain-containing protein [Puniceicoccales bacterium]|nr:DUF4013 domain-containing protein [Puniceicoccales bacterium]
MAECQMKNVLFPRFSDDHLWTKVSIGVLLMFVPIVNLLAFGYLYRFMMDPRHSTDGGVQLPDWCDWGKLFSDGLRMILFVATYAVGAFVLSAVAEWLVVVGSFGLLHIPWSMIMPLILTLFLPLFFVALMQYQRTEQFNNFISGRGTLHYLRYLWWPMIWPSLAFVGLQYVCGVLYGIAWFVGFGVAIASYGELLRHYGDRLDDNPHGTGIANH